MQRRRGRQKLSGKRTGFGRNSGKRTRTDEAIRSCGESYRSTDRGSKSKKCLKMRGVSEYFQTLFVLQETVVSKAGTELMKEGTI